MAAPQTNTNANTNEPPTASVKALDLVFCCDCTSSMSSYLQSAQQNIREIMQEIVAMEKCDVRFALVEYRDHPPQDNTYVIQVHEFSSSLKEMRNYVDNMAAHGGGDGPEAVADALKAALDLDYRKEAAKVVCLIADAPPHGIEPSGDGFPNGCPCGIDPLDVAKKMAERGILIYAVAVEPSLSNSYKFARGFMRSIAKITTGQFLPLTNAKLLPKAIVFGAVEELSLNQVMDEVVSEVQELKKKDASMTDEEVVVKVSERLKEKKIVTNHMECESVYDEDLPDDEVECFENAETLMTAKSHLPSASVSKPSPKAHAPSRTQKIDHKSDVISGEQVKRVYNKAMNMHFL